MPVPDTSAVARLDNFPLGAEATFLLTVRVSPTAPRGPNSIVNTARASTTTTENDLGNNSSMASTAVLKVADLQIMKTDNKTATDRGEMLRYIIEVKNVGPDNVMGATVTDDFPDTLSGGYSSVTTGNATAIPGSGSGDINDTVNMPVGSTITYTVDVLVSNAARNEIVNIATVTAPTDTHDPDLNNNSALDRDTLPPVIESDLAITITDTPDPVQPGSNITYTITLTNNGPSTAGQPGCRPLYAHQHDLRFGHSACGLDPF